MHTAQSLSADLARLGVPSGTILVLHSGYRPLGPIEGGPAAVVSAVRTVAGEHGTVLAPAFTTQLIDPATWPTPPSPEERERLMAAMPLFDPAHSPPYKMGAIATALWQTPGAMRSNHPVTSWAAIGPAAPALTHDHPLDDPEGLEGPVGRAYRADAWILLLGVGHDANTTIHLGESMLDMPHLYALPDRYPVALPDGSRQWRTVAKTTKCSDGFVRLEPHLQSAGVIRRGKVGDADVQLLRSRDVVRTVVTLLSREPAALLCDDPECVHCPTSRALLRDWHPTAPPELLS
jgi:aminoglycoside 3-N-acetyltransferase